MDERAIAQAAERLAERWRERRQDPSLDAGCRPESVDDGYAVQAAFVARLESPRVGWKIGATSVKVQALLGLSEPFAGQVLEATLLDSPASLEARDLIEPMLESEFAVRLDRDLAPDGAPYDRADVAAAVAAVIPAIEVIEPRVGSWLSGAPLAIADNGVHGRLVLGSACEAWRGLDLAMHEVILAIDEREVGWGSSGEVLGHPLEALAWLANDRATRGEALKAGEVVATGSCTGLTPVKSGRCVADFGSLGQVVLDIVE